MKDHPTLPARGWWITPLICAILFVAGIAVVWQTSEIGQELLAKSFMTIAGYLATPFILETSAALLGLVVVLVFNEYRRAKDGPDYVEMMVEDEKPATGVEKRAPSEVTSPVER